MIHQYHRRPCCPMHAMLATGTLMGIGGPTEVPDGPLPSFSDGFLPEPSDHARVGDDCTRDLFEVARPGQAIIVRGATVHTMDARGSLPGHDVIAVDGVIRAVQPAGQSLPDDALTVDGAGRFLIPGLTDIHQHPPVRIFAEMYAGMMGPDVKPEDLVLPYDLVLFLYLAAGITRIQVMAGTREELALRDGVRAKKWRGPTMRVGVLVDGTPMFWSPLMSWVANDREGGRTAARRAVEDGYDFVKPYTILGRDALHGLGEEAKALGIEVMGHVPRSVMPEEAFACGQTGVAHVFEYFWNDKSEDRFTDEWIERKIKATVERGAVVQSTLVIGRMLEYDAGLLEEPVSFDDMMDPVIRKLMREDSAFIQGWRADPILVEAGRNATQNCLTMAKALTSAGVTFLTGTDAYPSSVTGTNSLHHELEMFVHGVGMSPIDTLRASTVACAEYQGEGAVAGTIAAGMRSDMVLLDADPVADIRATRKIDSVILGDALLRKEAILEGISRAKARYDAMPVPA